MKEKFIFFFFLLRILFAQSDNGIIITEIMFNPLEPNGEFVELFNATDSAVNLSGYRIKYSTAKADTIITVNNGMLLPPQHYAVIFENDYDLLNGEYIKIISDSTLVLQIDNGKFGSYGMANSSNRTIVLLTETNDTVDYYTYSADNKKGYSDEKICNTSNAAENWSNSKILHGTPGKTNSVSQKNYDLVAVFLKVYPEEIYAGSIMDVSFKVANIGKKNIEHYKIKIFLDENGDSLTQTNEILLDTLLGNINNGDSLTVHEKTVPGKSGFYNLFAEIIFIEDENPEDNIIIKEIPVKAKPNSANDIIINEIMYQPNGNEPEWVELFNRTDSKINIKNWRFADKTSKPVITDSTCFVASKEYLILTDDSEILLYHDFSSPIKVFNLPSLNNKGDNLKLYDSLGRVIDSVNYCSVWGGGNGYSLERISTETASNDSSNWKTSQSKSFSTPGKINSVTPKNNDLKIYGLALLPKYAVTGKSFKIEYMVINKGLNDVPYFSIEIYHDINLDNVTQSEELLKNISGNYLSAGDSIKYSEILSDFTEGSNVYILKVIFNNDEFLENNQISIPFIGVDINETRNDLIVNEIMFAPNSYEPEWIEVYNRSNKIINLRNYQVADLSDTVTVTKKDIIIHPDSYFTFADDSSFTEIYPDCNNIIVAQLPNLNNSGDRIILLDSLNRIIDSLNYSGKWNKHKGVSLERISSEKSSVDSLNWSSAKLDSGGTPSEINSISQKDFDLFVKQILFIPSQPEQNETVSISAKALNIGKRLISFVLRLFEINSGTPTLLESSPELSLSPEDSLLYNFVYKIIGINKKHSFLVNALAKSEQDTSNNQTRDSIILSFTPLTLAVNEIMYSPINGEPEWVELLNVSDDSINIKGIKISDIYRTPKETIINDNIFLKSGEFLVIAKDSAIYDYHTSLTGKTIICNFANLNNDTDGVVIRDFYNQTIDSVKYNNYMGGTNGYSLERIFATQPSNDSTNWESSTDLELSTPGKKNSVTPFQNDLMISSVSLLPELPRQDDETQVKLTIKNIGLNKALDYKAEIMITSKNIPKLTDKIKLGNLERDDSLIVVSDKKFVLKDSVKIEAEIIYEFDDNTENNKITTTVYAGAKRKSVIITEFMANPQKDNSEWIELYNMLQRPVDLSTWFIGDLFPVQTMHKISDSSFIVEPDEYVVIASDTSAFGFKDVNVIQVKFGTLGNNEDGIVLFDFNGNVVDSLKYDYHDWKIEKGRSSERISFTGNTSDFNNWLPSLSVTGGTPGEENSINFVKPAANNSLIINEIMFDPETTNSEFVELYNLSGSSIDIGGWQLVVNDKKFFELSSSFYSLGSEQYFLIASDSLIFNNYNLDNKRGLKILNKTLSLPNNTGTIVITDHWGSVIDSISYSSDWHNPNIAVTKNKSLERISFALSANDENNWSTSVNKNGATPCKINSVFIKNKNKTEGINFSPNPFSPDNDGFEDFTIINFSIPFATAQIRVKIFDDHGRVVRDLVNNKSVASEGSIVFNGLDDEGNPLRIGMYIVYFEAVDIVSGKTVSYKDVIVVARKL